MKRIEFVAPVESMRGNLSGKQKLQYAKHDNPAFEAPNGAQSAKNYQARFIGAKRAKDGLKYFSVRTKQTSVLNGKTRMQMAITGSIAAIKSALIKHQPSVWAKIVSSFNYLKEGGLLPEGITTLNKYVDYNLRYMLRYKRVSWSFTQASISFTIGNPFKLDNTSALVISQSIWNKFAAVLAFTEQSATPATRVDEFSIDGIKFINPNYSADFGTIKGGASAYCANLVAQWQPITLATAVADANILYQGQQVYTDAGVAVNGETLPLNSKFTTIAPEA